MPTLTRQQDVNNILQMANTLQQEGNPYNIISVFDDGGFRELLLLKMFGLTKVPGRGGDDGFSPTTGMRYELKTVNLIDTKGQVRKRPGITTCHHVNHEIIARYRQVNAWLIGVFYINQPARIYEVPTQCLEPYFAHWENRLNTEANLTHINNPKIGFLDVIRHGHIHYHDNNYDEHFLLNEELPPRTRTRRT